MEEAGSPWGQGAPGKQNSLSNLKDYTGDCEGDKDVAILRK